MYVDGKLKFTGGLMIMWFDNGREKPEKAIEVKEYSYEEAIKLFK